MKRAIGAAATPITQLLTPVDLPADPNSAAMAAPRVTAPKHRTPEHATQLAALPAGQTFYRLHGLQHVDRAPRQPLVVMVHGIGGDNTLYSDAIAPALADAGRVVLTYGWLALGLLYNTRLFPVSPLV